MQLWTEYEGRTVDEIYTLRKLLRSEGRNGFFSTASPKGKQAVIRLTESHYDEDELLARWKRVSKLAQSNLIGIERAGRTSIDGVPLTFALLELEDGNLEEVLRERPLTTEETLEVAKSVAAALSALHAAGLVHEHVEAANVLAVGETVKLRSDCVRECVADKEFNTPEGCAELRRVDTQAFARLLLRCLTLDTTLQPNARLPEPFYRIVPEALQGQITVEQMHAVLCPPVAPRPIAAAAAVPASTTVGKSSSVSAALAESAPVVEPQARRFRPRNQIRVPVEDGFDFKRWGMYGAAVLAVLLVALLWRWTSAKPKPQTLATAQPAAATSVTAPAQTAMASPTPAVATTPVHGWRVIAYTYNRQAQAEAMVAKLNAKHGVLQPQLFSPTGRGPWLVSLGGAMIREDAAKVLQRARHSGLPRDTFLRNY
jgi:hypothetical protein